MCGAGSRVLVVGAGYLGRALAATLRRKDGRLCTLDVHAPADIVGDGADPRVLQGLTPGYIFLCQATHGGDAETYQHCFADVTCNVLQCFPAARVIFCSSTSLYGGQGGCTCEESSPCLNTSPRAQILQQVEKRVLAQGGVVARLAALYGPSRSVLLSRYRAGISPVFGSPSRMLNYIHIQDAISALSCLMQAPCGIYNLVGETLSKADILMLLEEITPFSGPLQEPAASVRGGNDQIILAEALQSLGWQAQHRLADFLKS